MAQRIVTLIRHGQCVTEGENPPLTQLGRKQAAITAGLFKEHGIKTIHYSTLQRSQETAEIIAQYVPTASLIGYESLWEGIPTIPPQFNKIFEEYARENPDYQAFNVRNVQSRLDDTVSNIFTLPEDRDVHDLVVCHGNVIRYLICRALNIDPHARVQFHPLANCSLSQVIIAPNSVQEVRNSGITLTTLFTFNETWHLPPDLRTLRRSGRG